MNEQVTEQERVMPDTSSGPGKSALKSPLLVEVIATRDWDKGVDFLLRWEYPKDVWNSGPMVFATGDPDRKIEYDLDDQTGLGLAFEQQADDCIWVAEGPCPTTKPHKGSDKDQIKDKDRASAKKLKLKNVNDQTCNLHYALRFTGASWSRPEGTGTKTFKPPYEYDPEYRNSGGGGSNT
jgi:hypothetical protein